MAIQELNKNVKFDLDRIVREEALERKIKPNLQRNTNLEFMEIKITNFSKNDTHSISSESASPCLRIYIK